MYRYIRHIDLPEIGNEGQKVISNAKVLIVGAGGLGAPASLYLTAAGIGHLGIVDDDHVDLANLQRQIIYQHGDIGKSKVKATKRQLELLNSEACIEIYETRINESNVNDIVPQYDVVIDATDNFATRYLLNRVCYALRKPLVSASVHHFDGQVTTFKAYAGEGHPCYECLYPISPDPVFVPTCTESGVLGPLVGIIGSMQAAEAIKEVLGIGKSLSGSIAMYNSLYAEFRHTRLVKNTACRLCSNF